MLICNWNGEQVDELARTFPDWKMGFCAEHWMRKRDEILAEYGKHNFRQALPYMLAMFR